MKILLTGASSFTGHWLVRELASAGHEIWCPLTGHHSRYDGPRLARMRNLPESVRVIENAAFGTEAFHDPIQDLKPEVICHHGAEARNHRSPDFDPFAATNRNSFNVQLTLKRFASSGGKGLLSTGSVFEAHEGQGELPLKAFSPYGLSKTLTSCIFEYYARESGLRFAKFVIPNPFGPLEEPRFTGYLMETWKMGGSACVRTPDYIRDNIPVDLLALAYRQLVQTFLRDDPNAPVIMRPSGYVESQGNFAERLSREVSQRTGWECKIDKERQIAFPEPRIRFNDSPAWKIAEGWNEDSFWDQFVNYYSTNA